MSDQLTELVNEVTKNLLKMVSDYKGEGFSGAYSLRQDGKCVDSMSSKNVQITSKTDKPGIIVHVAPGTHKPKNSMKNGAKNGVKSNSLYFGNI